MYALQQFALATPIQPFKTKMHWKLSQISEIVLPESTKTILAHATAPSGTYFFLLSKFVVFDSHPCDLWLCFSLKVELISLENFRSKQRIKGSIFLPTWQSWLWMLVMYSLLTALCGDIFLTLKVWYVSWRFFIKICIYGYIFLALNVFLVVGYCQEKYKSKNTKMPPFSAE